MNKPATARKTEPNFMMFCPITISVNIRGMSQPRMFISLVTSFTDELLSVMIPTSPGWPFGSRSARSSFGSSTAKLFFTYCFIFTSNSAMSELL